MVAFGLLLAFCAAGLDGLDIEMYMSSPKVSPENSLADLLANFNHHDWWKERHGLMEYHTLDSLRSVSLVLVRQRSTLWQELLKHCVEACPQRLVCNGASLRSSLNKTWTDSYTRLHGVAIQIRPLEKKIKRNSEKKHKFRKLQ